jgi:hypothetical protein
MRALTIALLALAALPSCANTDSMLEDVTYGKEIDGDFVDVLDRAEAALRKEFPKGLDPDKTHMQQGELWTVWHVQKSTWYRGTVRRRAHVRVEALDGGKCRIGVAVVQQRNDNIENPTVESEAKWVAAAHDQETATRIEQRIAKRYLANFKPSKAWEAKHDKKDDKGLRQDLVDRYKDVDLEQEETPDEDKEFPSATGKKKSWDPTGKGD